VNLFRDILTQLATSGALPYLIAASISAVLALAEIVSVFERDPARALRTWGAFWLIFLNAAFASVLFALVSYLSPAESNRYLVSIGVGFGLPVLLRTNFTLIKPLDSTGGKGIGITFDEMYGRLQGFFRRSIDVSLAARRVRTVEQAIERLSLKDLEQKLRLLLEGGLLTVGEGSQGYVEKILNREGYDDRRKQMLLSFGILNYGGDRMLERMVKRAPRDSSEKANAGGALTATSVLNSSVNAPAPSQTTPEKDTTTPVVAQPISPN
jgi:hypothetical protein